MKNARQVFLAICMAAIVVCSWLGPLDAPATEQVDAGLKRALISFATARALNGVISELLVPGSIYLGKKVFLELVRAGTLDS